MAKRALTQEEAAALGLPMPTTPKRRALSAEEAQALGLALPAQPTKEEPGRLEALARGAAQGATLGFGDEGGGVGAAGMQAIVNMLPKSVQQRMDLVEATPSDAYRYTRDENRKGNAAAQKAHSGYYLAGNVAGGIATAPLTAGAGGVATLGQALKTGALLGAAGGLGASDAELTGDSPELLKAGLDTVLGGTAGAASGGVGYGVGRAAPVLLRALRSGLKNAAIDKGRIVLTNGADQLSKRLPVAEEAVQEALDSGAIVPWGTTRGAFERLGQQADDLGRAYGATVDELHSRGVQGPIAEEVAAQLRARGADVNMRTMNDAIPAEYMANAQRILQKAEAPAPASFAASVFAYRPAPPPRSPIPLPRAEELKRSLQEAARYGRYEETPLNEARREIASIVRQANEDAITRAGEAAGPNSEIGRIADTFVPLKRKLGRVLEAEAAAQRGTAAAAKRTANASGPNMFDLAQTAQATGMTGLPAYLLSSAGKVWRQRGPSTFAWGLNTAADTAGAMSQLAAGAPNRGLYGGLLGASTERATLADILGGPEDPEALRTRALIEALRGR